jgi:hypothetical protein
MFQKFHIKRVGMSLGDFTSLVSLYQRKMGRDSDVAYGAVQHFVVESPICKLGNRATKKSGKGDLASDWCVARNTQCEQLLALFELDEAVPPGAACEFSPCHVLAIAWWDERQK